MSYDTIFFFLLICLTQLRFFYQDDLKYFFDVAEPLDVIKRALFSMCPGTHGSLILKPDLYGPALCVLALPQVWDVNINFQA